MTGPTVWFHLDQPIFYSIGLHSEGVTGLNLDYFRHLALPVLTLTFTSVAAWSRYLRAVDARRAQRRLRAHRAGEGRAAAQGDLRATRVRNALIPFTTVTALDTAFLIGGVIIVEQIFSISGMGQAFLTALQAGDAPFLLAWFVIVAVAVIVFNLLADVFYVVLDPRIRLS